MEGGGGADFRFLPFVTAHRFRIPGSSSGEFSYERFVFKKFSRKREKF
jgi:hypothetical protein